MSSRTPLDRTNHAWPPERVDRRVILNTRHRTEQIQFQEAIAVIKSLSRARLSVRNISDVPKTRHSLFLFRSPGTTDVTCNHYVARCPLVSLQAGSYVLYVCKHDESSDPRHSLTTACCNMLCKPNHSGCKGEFYLLYIVLLSLDYRKLSALVTLFLLRSQLKMLSLQTFRAADITPASAPGCFRQVVEFSQYIYLSER